MRKTARKSCVALTSIAWLVRPDNTNRFRWMGCWCAVYAPPVQEKADSRSERTRTRRGTKKRGFGSKWRRISERARGRAARDASQAQIPQILYRANRARERIDARHERGCQRALGMTRSRQECEKSLSEVLGKIAGLESMGALPISIGLRRARKYLRRRLSSLRRRELSFWSALWGFPLDATARRIEKIPAIGVERAVPRVPLPRWEALLDDVVPPPLPGGRYRPDLPPTRSDVRALGNSSPREILPHTASDCSRGIGCPTGVAICRACGWRAVGGPRAGQARGNRRREGNHPVVRAPRRRS